MEKDHVKMCFISTGYPPDRVGSKEYYASMIYNQTSLEIPSNLITRFWNKRIKEPGIIQVSSPRISKIGTIIWARRVASLIKAKLHPRHVHAFDFRSAYAAYLSNASFSMTLHLDDLDHMKRRPFLRRTFIRVLKRADQIFLTSLTAETSFKKIFPDFVTKSKTLLLGVNVNLFSPFVDAEGLRNRLGIDGRVILHVSGELTENQLLKTLIQAHQILREKMKIHLLIIGQPSESFREMYEKLKKEYSGKDVLFLEYVPHSEINKYYALADVFIALSKTYDGVGLSILEAMASAKPVLCSPIDLYTEIGSIYILMIPNAEDPSSIATTLESVLRDRHFAKTLGFKAREHVMKKYTETKMVEKLIAYFKSKVLR